MQVQKRIFVAHHQIHIQSFGGRALGGVSDRRALHVSRPIGLACNSVSVEVVVVVVLVAERLPAHHTHDGPRDETRHARDDGMVNKCATGNQESLHLSTGPLSCR